MTQNIQLFYSKKCQGSSIIMSFLNQNPATALKLRLLCVDDYYKQHRKFPEGIHGTPTLFVETETEINAYPAKDALNYLRQMSSNKAPQQQSMKAPHTTNNIPWQMNPIPEPIPQKEQAPPPPAEIPGQQPQKVNYGSMKPAPKWANGGSSTKMAPIKPTNPNASQPLEPPNGGKVPEGYNPFAVNVNDDKKDSSGSLSKLAAEMEETRKHDLAQRGGGTRLPTYNPTINI